MTPRRTDHQYRRDQVLGVVVDQYVRTTNPVSSGHIANAYHFDLSSATIRNILAELERDGLLTHPHTSSGRVPTQDGYRYYVDNLMNEIGLLEAEKLRIKTEVRQDAHDLEELIEKTSAIISDLTHYTSIISIDGMNSRIFCRGMDYIVSYPDHTDLKKIRDILRTIEEKERILEIINRQIQRKIKIYIGHEMACSHIEGCSMAVSQYRISNGITGRIAVLGPTRMDYQRVVSTLDYLSNLMEEVL